MITTTRPNYSSEESFERLVGICQKNAMSDVASLLDLPIKKSLKKDLFLSEMARQLSQQASQLLKKFPTYEIELLSRVLDAPKGVGVVVSWYLDRSRMMIIDCCYVVCFQIANDEWRFFLSTESMREVLTSAVVDVKQYYEQYPYIVKGERLAVGMMNYFGCVPSTWVTMKCSDLLRNQDQEIDMVDVLKLFDRILFRMCRTEFIDVSLTSPSKYYKKEYFVSPMLTDMTEILDEQMARPEIQPNYLSVSEDELLAYGTLPYVKPVRTSEKALYDYLKKRKNIDKAKLDWYYTKIWYHIQRDQKPDKSLSLMSTICQFASMTELQSAMNLVTEFSNNTPKWILSGLSSNEVFEKYEKPKLRPLPNMHFNFGSPSSPFASQPKVGRNDPCPCGSGKKYKHCCGK